MLLSFPRAHTRTAKAGLVWDTGSPVLSLVRVEQSLPAWPGSHWLCSTAGWDHLGFSFSSEQFCNKRGYLLTTAMGGAAGAAIR